MLLIHDIQTANISSPMGNEAFQLHVIVGVCGGPGGQNAISTLKDTQDAKYSPFTPHALNVLVVVPLKQICLPTNRHRGWQILLK